MPFRESEKPEKYTLENLRTFFRNSEKRTLEKLMKCIPDNFFYMDKIFGAKILHPNVRKSGQIGFFDKIA